MCAENYCRKHADFLNPFSAHFSLSNFLLAMDGIVFTLLLPYAFLIYTIWVCIDPPTSLLNLVISLYMCAMVFEIVQVLTTFVYSANVKRDLVVCLVFPFMPFFQMVLMAVRIIANTQELVLRSSFKDNYVPEHVRHATWHW